MTHRINWTAIREAFFTDDGVTYRQLSEQFPASLASIQRKGRQERWQLRRRTKFESELPPLPTTYNA